MLTKGVSKMSREMISTDTDNATSLQGLEDGATPCDLLESPTTIPSGQDRVHASLGLMLAKDLDRKTTDTYGPHGIHSSWSVALSVFLASKLQARLPLDGWTGLRTI